MEGAGLTIPGRWTAYEHYSTARALECAVQALYKEVSSRATSGSETHPSDFTLRAVNQLVQQAHELLPQGSSVARLEALQPNDMVNDALAALALIRGELECGKGAAGPAESMSRAPQLRQFLPSAIAGLGIGIGMPFVVDPDPAIAGTLLASGSALQLTRQLTVGSHEERADIDTSTTSETVDKSDEQPRSLFRRAIRRAWSVSGEIATGAMSSGVGFFLVEAVRSFA